LAIIPTSAVNDGKDADSTAVVFGAEFELPTRLMGKVVSVVE
jgi:hypothetical protein